MSITLRNNLMLLCRHNDLDASRCVRTLWTVGLSAPCFVVAFLQINTTDIVEVTGGILGVFILAVSPAMLVCYARRHNIEQRVDQANPLRSSFQSPLWIYLVLCLSPALVALNLYFYIYGKTTQPIPYCE